MENVPPYKMLVNIKDTPLYSGTSGQTYASELKCTCILSQFSLLVLLHFNNFKKTSFF